MNHQQDCTGIFNPGPTCESCLDWVAKKDKESKLEGLDRVYRTIKEHAYD